MEFILVCTKSKKMNKFALDLQVVKNNKEELEKRLNEIVTKMIIEGDKKQIIAFTDFELWKIGETNENYEVITDEKEKLFDYEELIQNAKKKIVENLKGE